MNRIKQGIMEILGPGSRREEVERGRKGEGSFPHRPLIHTVPSVPNPIMACGGDDSEVGLADS